MRERGEAVWTTRILKGGALLAETQTLLSQWSDHLSVPQNLDRFRKQNLFAKASRSRVDDILNVLRRRYLQSPPDRGALVTLARANRAPQSLNPILFFYSARADRLLHDAVTDFLASRKRSGDPEVRVKDTEKWLERSEVDWTETTIVRCARSLLSALRDFGLLNGAVRKTIAPFSLPVAAFAYIAMLLKQEQASGNRLLGHPEWNLFFLSCDAVERHFVEAHQRGLLEYNAAGSVIRIAFPAPTVEEYAGVIVSRAS